MEETHNKISKLVVAAATVLLVGLFMLATPQSDAQQGSKGKGKQKQGQNQRQNQNKQGQNQRQNQNKQNPQAHHSYQDRSDYDKYHGYRERPYDNRRHYGNFDYSGHRYDYRGHWRSWDQWDRYAKAHPNIYKHGRYYRENSHLMFRFCDPGGGGCFFFSIGK